MKLSYGYGSGNWCQEMWIEIFDRAKKKGKIVEAHLGEHEFEYALINPEDNYEEEGISTENNPYEYSGDLVTFWIKDAEEENRIGLNEGGLSFVLERTLPRSDFSDYIGLHEYVEATFHSSNEQKWHGNACKIELEEVLKQEPEFIEEYATWLVTMTRTYERPDRSYFGRAIPSFLNTILLESKLSPVELLKAFKSQLDLGYHLNRE